MVWPKESRMPFGIQSEHGFVWRHQRRALLRIEASPTDEAKVQGVFVFVRYLSVAIIGYICIYIYICGYHVIFPSCGIPRSWAFLDPSSTSPLPIIYSYAALHLCYGTRLSVRKALCLMHLDAFVPPWRHRPGRHTSSRWLCLWHSIAIVSRNRNYVLIIIINRHCSSACVPAFLTIHLVTICYKLFSRFISCVVHHLHLLVRICVVPFV